MKRRVNKSSKVPNVKLRPAQRGATATGSPVAPQSSYLVQDTQTDLGSTLQDPCPRPFRGVVLCTTGDLDKPTLLKQALELGATSTSAFTDRVTHLVAASHGGAKYVCALERGIPIMLPDWITESYKVWLRGDDIDLEASVAAHRIPIFSGVTLCPSGIDCIRRRTLINKKVTAQGGAYVKNLERPVKVTHLLCSGDEETEKMRYAKKFNRQGEAKIWLVWEEWFWDSLDYGGRLDEVKYSIDEPRRPFITENSRVPPLSSVLVEPTAEQQSPPEILPASAGTYQSFAEDEQPQPEDEPASIRKRVPAETLQMWQTLLKPRGYEIKDSGLVRDPSGTGRELDLDLNSPSGGASSGVVGDGSVIGAFRRASSSAPQVHKDPTVRSRPFRTASASEAPQRVNVQNTHSTPQSPRPSAPRSSTLFAGMVFRALGEARSAAVRAGIEGCGGRMVGDEEIDVEVNFIIVRLVSGSKIYREEKEESEKVKYRTECWLERCLFLERVYSPEEHVSFVPLAIDTPVHGAEGVSFCWSGLDQSEICWVKRLARALGLSLAQTFTPRCTHLLCPSRTGAKYDKACEWGVPVVGMEWIQFIATEGRIPSFGDDDRQETVITQSAKSKGRAKANDSGVSEMVDDEKGQQGTCDAGDGQSPVGDSINVTAPPSSGGFKPEEAHYEQGSSSSTSTSTSDQGSVTLRDLREMEREITSMRVPSSTSPSPMKIPQNSSPQRNCSPVKVSAEVTKALQDSITRLLGKRPLERSPPRQQHHRNGKRVRPQANPRPAPRRQSPDLKTPTPLSSAIHVREPLSPCIQTLDPLAEQSGIDILPDASVVEESIRVVYEDPVQREERQRLMSLFESRTPAVIPVAEIEAGQKSRAVRKRRSTRIAGF